MARKFGCDAASCSAWAVIFSSWAARRARRALARLGFLDDDGRILSWFVGAAGSSRVVSWSLEEISSSFGTTSGPELSATAGSEGSSFSSPAASGFDSFSSAAISNACFSFNSRSRRSQSSFTPRRVFLVADFFFWVITD